MKFFQVNTKKEVVSDFKLAKQEQVRCTGQPGCSSPEQNSLIPQVKTSGKLGPNDLSATTRTSVKSQCGKNLVSVALGPVSRPPSKNSTTKNPAHTSTKTSTEFSAPMPVPTTLSLESLSYSPVGQNLRQAECFSPGEHVHFRPEKVWF